MIEFIVKELVVQVFFSDSSSHFEYLPIEDCIPSKLSEYARSRGALFCLCPSKYGCRQFVA